VHAASTAARSSARAKIDAVDRVIKHPKIEVVHYNSEVDEILDVSKK
jgi:hypothetical protein